MTVRALIVEEDQSTQKALKRLFESEGSAVQIRGDGKSALEAFHAAALTAIILDLHSGNIQSPYSSGHKEISKPF